jgi:hypothetical protein
MKQLLFVLILCLAASCGKTKTYKVQPIGKDFVEIHNLNSGFAVGDTVKLSVTRKVRIIQILPE